MWAGHDTIHLGRVPEIYGRDALRPFDPAPSSCHGVFARIPRLSLDTLLNTKKTELASLLDVGEKVAGDTRAWSGTGSRMPAPPFGGQRVSITFGHLARRHPLPPGYP